LSDDFRSTHQILPIRVRVRVMVRVRVTVMVRVRVTVMVRVRHKILLIPHDLTQFLPL